MLLPFNGRFVDKLQKAQADFEKATKDFLECRCYTYYQMVLITSKRLLEASDEYAAATRMILDTY